MIRSLRTGISGLKVNQVRMDVVGNNIANVNTVAFKRSRAAFAELLGQQLLGVGRTAGGTGINPSSVGLGVGVASIDQNWGQGALENTSIATDLALSGDGFFVVRQGDQEMLSRAGNFTFNRDGQLVTSGGLNVRGWRFNPTTGELIPGQLQDVKMDINAQLPAKRTENVYLGGNLPAGDDVDTVRKVTGTVFDSRGTPKTVLVEFTRTVKMGDPIDPDDPAAGTEELDVWTFDITDTEGNSLTGGGGGTISFGPDGQIVDINGNAISDPPNADEYKFDFNYDIDGDGLDENGDAGAETFTLVFGNENGGSLTQSAGSDTATVQAQDGWASGTVASYAINPEGILELTFTNGVQQKLFQLAVGKVNNPNGLEQQGENLYMTTSASGDVQLGRAGRDLRTAVVSGALEMSNVDLGTEFTELIVAQRGYQASARVVTTSDELLQETVQLKR